MFEPMELTNDAVIKVIGVGGAAVTLLSIWSVNASKALSSSL